MSAELEPLVDERALSVVGAERTLVVADLHIGIEYELHGEGIHLPSHTPEMLERLKRALSKGFDRVVLLGDVKHSPTHLSPQEREEVPVVLEELSELAHVDIVLGNHDAELAEVVPEGVSVHPSEGVVLDGVGYVHGHAWMSPKLLEADTIVCAHTHPLIRFVDSLGCTITLPCWLRTRLSAQVLSGVLGVPSEDVPLVVIPAFCALCGGVVVNDPHSELLGVLFSSGAADVGGAECYLLDGTKLGRLCELARFSEKR
ncbi:MAG: metallophosphoesterase [Methermicoccaceae archaeon]